MAHSPIQGDFSVPCTKISKILLSFPVLRCRVQLFVLIKLQIGCSLSPGGDALRAVCALGPVGSRIGTRSEFRDAQFYKILLGASVAARVVVAFHSHSSTHNHGGHDHDHSHGSEEEEEHDHSHGSCNHDHDHSNEHEHEHHVHSHGCGHSHGHSTTLNAVQKLIKKAAEVLKIAVIAEAWRENVAVVCVSTVLLLLGAVVPLVQTQAASYQNLLVIPALPLTGVPALLDAIIDIAGGNVNIHVLMAFATLASVIMGSALEGGLLLAMFSLSHLAEDYFTAKAMGDVKALKDRNPKFALVLDDFNERNPPSLSTVPYKQLPLKEVAVGAYVLVKAGEVVPVRGALQTGTMHGGCGQMAALNHAVLVPRFPNWHPVSVPLRVTLQSRRIGVVCARQGGEVKAEVGQPSPEKGQDPKLRLELKAKIAALECNARTARGRLRGHTIGVDLGDAKTGLSVSLGGYAPRPLTVVRQRGDKLLETILQVGLHEKADEFVVGLPKAWDGKDTEQANKCRSFAGRLSNLAARRGWRVYLQDEYGTSQDALDYMIEIGSNRRSRKEQLDAYAAKALLSNYFESSGSRAQLVVPKLLELQQLLCQGPSMPPLSSLKDDDEFGDFDDDK